MGKEKQKGRVKCPGRFKELREYLHNDLLEVMRSENLIDEDTGTITEDALTAAWFLIAGDIFNFDQKDPYYDSKVDTLRKTPALEDGFGYISLLPLFPSTYHFEDAIFGKYLRSMGNKKDIINKIIPMAHQSDKFLQNLGREPSKIWVPTKNKHGNSVNLTNYIVSADYGLGTVVPGGVLGGGIRSDSPFLLNVYHTDRVSHEKNLVGVIGFWPQDNQMIVSQMQSCKNAKFPEETCFGGSSLTIAETAARLMGFDAIKSYSAKSHPLFKEHPEDWAKLGKTLTCEWDNSARFLGYKPSNGRNGYYSKNLKDSPN